MHLRGHQNYYHPSWEGLVCNFTRMSFKQLSPLYAAFLTVCFHFTLNTSWKGKLLGHILHPEAAATCCKVLLPVTYLCPLMPSLLSTKVYYALLLIALQKEGLSSVPFSTPQIPVVSTDFYCNNLLPRANIVQVSMVPSFFQSVRPSSPQPEPQSQPHGPQDYAIFTRSCFLGHPIAQRCTCPPN